MLYAIIKPGDVLAVPGLGERVVGHIEAPYPGRLRIRLDAKFIESVYIEVLTR